MSAQRQVERGTVSTRSTDIVIVGAGPSGLFSVFQAGQLGLKCEIVDGLAQPGGQCTELYPDKPIYDVPGIPHCTGASLIAGLFEQAQRFAPVMHLGVQVEGLERRGDGRWRVTTSAGARIDARAVVVAAGAGSFTPRKLAIDGASAYEDASLLYSVKSVARFAGKRLVILGGGDSALDWVIALAPVAAHVTLVHRRDVFRAAAESVALLRALVEAGRVDLQFGAISALRGDAPDLSGALLARNDAGARLRCGAGVLRSDQQARSHQSLGHRRGRRRNPGRPGDHAHQRAGYLRGR
jgi:thioredoxin reductase (NADPH)